MSTAEDVKTANLEFFRTNLSRLLSDPLLRHKFVVIHGQEVKGSYDTFNAALRFAASNFPPAEFIIQRVIDDREVISFIMAAC